MPNQPTFLSLALPMEGSKQEQPVSKQLESIKSELQLLMHSFESRQALENMETLEDIVENNNQFKDPSRKVEEFRNRERDSVITEAISVESFRKLSNEHIQVYRVVEKGASTFALRDIQCGERIICEKALFSIDGIPLDSTYKNQARDIAHVFYTLDTEKQQDCLELCGPKQSGRCQNIIKIFNVNAFTQNKVSYLCQSIARINNSCIPNAWVSWDAKLEKACVHAICPIQMGEEVTISYFQDFDILDFESRKDFLSRRYNFTCACKACDVETDTGRKSHERRAQLKDIRSRIRDLYSKFDIMDRTKFEEEIGPLMSNMYQQLLDERLFGREYVVFLEVATKIRFKMEHVDLAKSWAVKCFHAAMVCYGKQSPLVAELWGSSLRVVFTEEEIRELGIHVKAVPRGRGQ